MNRTKSNNRPAKIILVNIGIMLAIVIIILVCTMHWISGYTMHGTYIKVPDVCGMNEENAAAVLHEAGLSYEISDVRFEKSMAAGMIIEQNPESGANVKLGREIYLTLNSGNQPTKAIPDLADNSSVREAESRLKSMGFNIAGIERINGDLDWVYGIKYRDQPVTAGTQLPEGSTLTIIAGNGNMILDLEEADSTDMVDDTFFDSML